MSVNAEALSRARIPFVEEYYDRLVYERDTLGRFRLKPGQKLPHLSINSAGYRGDEFSGQETVLLLGDSVTFGVGVSGNEARFSRFWEKASGLKMADASIRAYRVSQHFTHLPLLLDQLPRVQRVVLWCGFVDLAYWSIHGGRIEGSFQMDLKYPGQSPWKRRWAKLLRQPELPPLSAPAHGDISALVKFVMRYVRAIHDLCAARQIQTQVVLQPFVRERPQDPALRAITDFYDASTRAKCGVGWYEAAQRYAEELKQDARSRKIPFMDLQAGVTENDFFDQVHLREEAHLRLAQKGTI